MRTIDAELGEMRAVAVSPDGRFLAAAGANGFAAFEWATGEPVPGASRGGPSDQLAFDRTGTWAARVSSGYLRLEGLAGPVPFKHDTALRHTGGVAVSPDGKSLVATNVRPGGTTARLERWSLPALKPATGFDFWPPFSRLAFSPNGQFLGGVWRNGFELRYATSGGLDYRHRMPRGHEFSGPGFVTFAHDSGTCAFGWADEFHLLDLSTGTSRPLRGVPAQFRDAAFSPSANLFATVGADGRLQLWNPAACEVTRGYDWGCGPLTCLAFTADGTAGVCGTADGRLVQFDVDE